MFNKMILFGQLQEVENIVRSLAGDLLKYGIIAAVLLVVAMVAYKLLKPKKKVVYKEVVESPIDVATLGNHGPPATGPVLEYSHLPMRLAAVVLAPAGRIRELPPPDQLGDLFDAILPGLDRVVAAHRPLVRCWSPHVSTQGFAHTVFRKCRLPGDVGKGTPWCTLAGVFKINNLPMMAGLIMRAAEPNTISQEVIESEGQWRAHLQIRGLK